jgi:hypothetical protein
MMPTSSPFREPGLMSARTARYVAALIQLGDSFDYGEWLKAVRDEETQANRGLTASVLGKAVPAEMANRRNASPARLPERYVPAASMVKTVPVPRTIRRSVPDLRGTTSKDRLRRWLQKVQFASHDFQASRARDAVYDYLEAVFAIVLHFKVRRRTKRLLRAAFRFADLRFDKTVDPFTAVIRCTCGGSADNKLISKWARALRYATRRKPAAMQLKAFMKAVGGVNECAAGYANRRR